MTDWSTAQHVGPCGEEAEKRKQAALEAQAQRAAAQRAKIERFIDGEGGDPESGTTIVSAGPPAEAPKTDPAKAAMLAKLAAAKDKLTKLRRRKK